MRRAAVWVRDDLEEVRTRLLDRQSRRRLLVPTPNGTFVLGPNPLTGRTIKDTRTVLGGGIGLVWTESGIAVEHADYFDADPSLPAQELFRQEGLPAEAELIRWLDQGEADAAVPTHPREWWEKLCGEQAKDHARPRRLRGVARELIIRAVVLIALVVAFSLGYLRWWSELPAFFGWCAVGAAVLLPVEMVCLAVAGTRWRLEFPVLDPLGLRSVSQAPR